MISSLKNEFKDLKIIGQTIVPINNEIGRVKEYELLLRTRKNNDFPTDFFSKVINDQVGNYWFLNWLKQQIDQIMSNNYQDIYNLNLDPQQFSFRDTWKFIMAISQYRSRLKIEITERVPLTVGQIDLAEVIKRLKMTGFAVALDDICTGENSLSFVVKNYKSLKRIKFSVLDFRRLKRGTLKELLAFLLELSLETGLEFVIEGMSLKEVRQIYDERHDRQTKSYHLFWQAATEVNF